MSDPIVEAFKSLLSREGGANAVADVIGANPQSLYQIDAGIKLPSGKPKGVGKQLREKLERHYPGWLSATGVTRSAAEVMPADSGDNQLRKTIAQTMAPPKFGWEALMNCDELPLEFETELPDNAMSPDAPRGARCIFITNAEPEAGDWVLLTDESGNLFCRVYRLLKPGQWEAHALNAAFLPLDSARDGLRVLAVFDGMRGRRAAA